MVRRWGQRQHPSGLGRHPAGVGAAYDPDQWEAMGIDADLDPEPPPSNMALRMNGAAVPMPELRTRPYLDYAYGFTLMAILAPNDWTPATRQVIVSKWGAAGQRSYYWALDPDGIVSSRPEMALPRHGGQAALQLRHLSVTGRCWNWRSASRPTHHGLEDHVSSSGDGSAAYGCPSTRWLRTSTRSR